MAVDYQAKGKNAAAQFTLKVHRGEGMALLAMFRRSPSETGGPRPLAPEGSTISRRHRC